MKPELKRAVALVRAGSTYSDAAAEVGVSRCAVAGACDRAGVKAKITRKKEKLWRQRISKETRKAWADPVRRAARLEKYAKTREAKR